MAIDAGAGEQRAEGAGGGLGWSLGIADNDEALRGVVDDTRGGAIDANVAQSPDDAFRAEVIGKEFLIAESILQGEQFGVGVQ